MKPLVKYFLVCSAIGVVVGGGCAGPQKKVADPQSADLPQLVRFFSILQMQMKPGALYISGKGSAAADGGKNTFTAASSLSSYPLIELTIKSGNAEELNSCMQRVQTQKENHKSIDIRGMGIFTIKSVIDPPLNTGVFMLTRLDACGTAVSPTPAVSTVTAQAIPAADLVAVPERYLNQSSTITGHLVAAVHFGDPVSSLMLQSEGQSLPRFFLTSSLAAESRLALVHAAPGSNVILEGTLTRVTPKSLAAQSGTAATAEYEFDVSKVVSTEPAR